MSLTLVEARERARIVDNVSYDITLDLTDREAFSSRCVVRFDSREPGAPTFLELADASSVTIPGTTGSYAAGRVTLEATSASNEVTIEARLPYVTDGAGMHTFTDPADGLTYVSAYIGMDLAQRVFACFDQNDLKARITLRVKAPEGWTILANGRAVTTAAGLWEFAPTPPIPVAMFVMCAGPWHSRTWEHAGLPFGWHARASLAPALDRDFDDLRQITEACFDHYAEIFDEPFAFDSYDQAMVPGQNWGALETPGCVTYRDEHLPIGPPSLGERRDRATVIAHEMAHMWFGNLVTMRWWEDTWLQESFADYMGYRVAEAVAGVEDIWADFTIEAKPGAMLADERRSTHPVAALAEEVPDVETADGNFDAISYTKGNSCIRQLVVWLGDETFLSGVNAYLTRHRFGNADLVDFVAALDEAAAAGEPRDVRAWVEAWLRTTGFDTIRVVRTAEGPVLTREPAGPGDAPRPNRPHRLGVATYTDAVQPVSSDLVDLAGDPVPVPDAAVIIPNSGSETYARLRFDSESWARLATDLHRVADPTARAIVWITAADLVRCTEIPASDFLELVARHLPHEPLPTFVDAITDTARLLVSSHVPADQVTPSLTSIANACREGLSVTTSPEVSLSLTRALGGTSHDTAELARWLQAGATQHGVEVDPTLRWLTIWRLAQLGAVTADEITAQRDRDPSVVGDLGAARALAAIPDALAKEEAWSRLFDDPEVSNRAFQATATGFWDPERIDLIEPYIARYIEVAPAAAASRGATFGRRVAYAFPAIPLTAAHLEDFDFALRADVPTILRRIWQDRLDDLRPAARTPSS